MPTIIRHTRSEWDALKDIIEQKWISEEKTTKAVQLERNVERGFWASIQQYERQFAKWGFRKNVSSEQYDEVDKNLERGREHMEQVRSMVDGSIIPRKKLMKAIARRNRPTLLERWNQTEQHSATTVAAACNAINHTEPEAVTVTAPGGSLAAIETIIPLGLTAPEFHPDRAEYAPYQSANPEFADAPETADPSRENGLISSDTASFSNEPVQKDLVISVTAILKLKEFSGQPNSSPVNELILSELVKTVKECALLPGVYLNVNDWFALFSAAMDMSTENAYLIFTVLLAPKHIAVGRCIRKGIIGRMVYEIGLTFDNDRPAYREMLHDQLRCMLDSGFDARESRSCMEEGFSCIRSPLMESCTRSGLVEVTKALIAHGASIDEHVPSWLCRTALGVACDNRNMEALDLLITKGANLDAPANDIGEPCLAISVLRNHQDVVVKLLEAGATANPVGSGNPFWRTPLEVACGHGFLDITAILINHGARTDATYGAVALRTAAKGGHLKVCEILVEHEVKVSDLFFPVHLGVNNAIDFAVMNGHVNVVAYLLEHYEGSKSLEMVCVDALWLAVEENRQEVVDVLDRGMRFWRVRGHDTTIYDTERRRLSLSDIGSRRTLINLV